jgi:hypothetical protein
VAIQASRQIISKIDQQKALKVQAEVAACKDDLVYHLENHFYILDKDGNVRLMKPLKQAQKKLVAVLEKLTEMNIPRRVIILKARKEGMSTVVQALGYLEARDRGKTAFVIAHDSKTSNAIFEISKRFQSNYDLPKPEIPVPNKREMRFVDQEGLIVVDTANNVQAGTGLTPHFLHSSETAKWVKGVETSKALFQSIGDSPETTVILESTAQGFDSLFHPMWENAERNCKVEWIEDKKGNFTADIQVEDTFEWNGYVPVFISWMEDPDYQMAFESEDEQIRFESIVDDYENMLISKFGATFEQLKWRRWTLANKCLDDLRTFKQEYPSFPQEAFVVSGNARFNLESLDLMPVEDPVVGYLKPPERWDIRIEFVKESGNYLSVYVKPRDGHRYILASDPANGLQPEGTSDPDETVIHIYDLDDPEGMRQVATYAGNIPEEEIANPLCILAEWYNMAYIVVLVTGGYGTHIVSNVVEQYQLDRIMKVNQQWGLKEHVGNRPDLISSLASAIEHRDIIFHDFSTVDQCKHFKRSRSGKLEAETGWHDDHVSTAYAAVRGARLYPQNLRPIKQGMVDRRKMRYAEEHRVRRKDSGMDNWGGYSAC